MTEAEESMAMYQKGIEDCKVMFGITPEMVEAYELKCIINEFENPPQNESSK